MKSLKYGLLLLVLVFALGQPAFAADKINLNTASVAELTQVKGIGPATAERIVKYRKTQKFSSVDDLANVKGIGPKSIKKFRSQLTVSSTGSTKSKTTTKSKKKK